MTDELDRIRKAFAEQNTRPDRNTRDGAISAALKAFDEENSSATQGIDAADRLKGTGESLFDKIFRRRFMSTSINIRPIALGGASIVALAAAFIYAGQLDRILPPRPASLDETVSSGRNEQQKRDDIATRKPAKPAEFAKEEAETRPAAAPVPVQPAPLEDFRDGSRRQRNAPALQQSLGAGAAAPMAEADANTGIVSKQAAKQRIAPADHLQPGYYQDQGRDKFTKIEQNPVKLVNEDPVSTFSIDVDTASYSFMRASLNRNLLPQKDAVRVEELINYFSYNYPLPDTRETPFRAGVTVMPSPWNQDTRLMHIGIKGYDLPKADKPKSNLVFLLDTSGSMNAINKLPLLINSFKLLLTTLSPDDTVSIVTYAGSAGTVLEPTKAADKQKIIAALERLYAGGSTAGAEGIRQAYQLAKQNYDPSGVNRVILATDGDFNVGITNQEELKSFVERQRKSGITLSVLGFGTGNYNDALMQTLAQNGNGNAAYIDTLGEARKVLVDEAGSTLFTIAKDVKIQVEFNPAAVSEYRLIGYETRKLAREDFNNDKVDAGDIGAGHTVTAIYEFTPSGSAARQIDPLRYQKPAAGEATASEDEYAFVKIRYKLPKSDTSTLITTPVGKANEVATVAEADTEARFATAVAAFGQILRGGRYTADYSYDDVISLAQGAKGSDAFGYRAEFINLARLAKSAATLAPAERR